MFRMNLGKLLARKQTTQKSLRRGRRQVRLFCESLEDRCLPAAQAAWTIMVYITADNSVADAMNENIKELESALSQFNKINTPGSVQIAVLYDQSQASGAKLFATPIATSKGIKAAQSWLNTGEAILQANATPPDARDITTPFTLIGSQNTGKPTVLSQFVTWAAANAPAEHYALIFGDHGAGWRGFNFHSQAFGYGSLNAPEVAATLNTLAASAQPTKFDLIGFDECLMADAQVEDALAGVTSVIVGSEDLAWAPGLNYLTALSALNTASPSTVTASQLATTMVQSVSPRTRLTGYDTLSAVQTSALANLDLAITKFTSAALAPTTTAADWNAMAFARNQSPWYGLAEPDGYRDLGRFMSALASAPGVSAALQSAAANVSTALSNAVIERKADSQQSSGLSVYFPAPKEKLALDYFNPASPANPGAAAVFVKNTNWYSFLSAFANYAPARAVTPASFVGSGPGRSIADAFFLHDLIGPSNVFAGLSLPLGDGPQDAQWFSFTLAAPGVQGNAFAASYAPGGGTVHLSFFDSGSNLLGESNTGTGLESISLADLPAGTYFVQVEGGNDEPVPQYTLEVNAPTPAAIPPDYAYGNGAQATAYDLGPVASVAEFSGLTLEEGAQDWFQFQLAPSPIPWDDGPRSLTINGSSSQTLAVQVLDQAGKVLASASGSGSVNLTYPQADGTHYLLRVSGAAGGYALQFNPPLVTADDLQLSPDMVTSGQLLSLNGMVEEFVAPESYTILVNWGDNSHQTVLTLAADANDFEASHAYSQPGNYSITVTAVAATGLVGDATVIVSISPGSTPVSPVVTNPEKQLLPLTVAFIDSPESRASFVGSQFQLILQRGPEPAGVAYWVGQMQHGLSQEGLTAALLDSQEFITHSGGGPAWFGAIYQTLFNRQGDANGMAYWDAQLRDGLSPLALAQAFAGSQEWQSKQIADLYTANLGRPVDQAGLTFWLAEAGKTGIESVAAGVLASTEYFNSANGGSGSSPVWLDAVYGELFNRAPGVNEEAFWLGQI